ncbi:hypothetical protein AAHE18_09G247000 [Arachis hypogaea]|nr:uncharacterized protein DS421_9g286920 [Arachis hypogaea]
MIQIVTKLQIEVQSPCLVVHVGVIGITILIQRKMITRSSNGRRRKVWNNVARLLNGVFVILVGEVHFSFLSANLTNFSVIGPGGFFGGVEGSKPNANTFPWIANLRAFPIAN